MFLYRIRDLLNKTRTVFRYLIALEAIKVDKEIFKSSLQEIEHYLNNSDRTLSEYWVARIQEEHTEVFLSKVSQ